ncbi:N-6 DNA Methylase [Luteibacter sp. UNCMF366Tsu5.1]|nr:N-6 DNA Methylase [Luteibacter sp. UNCMF366Tsu5.1]
MPDKPLAPFSKVSITRRIRSLGQVAERHHCDATTIVGTLSHLWCRASFPALRKPALRYSKELAAEAEVAEFVAILRGMTFLDATYWLSSSYALLTTQGYQKELAMFFTPTSLTDGLLNDLTEQGVDFGRQSFMDPACGGAAFLAPIALRMRAALKKRGRTPLQSLRHIERHLSGTDLDATLCELSKLFLCMALHDDIQKTGYSPAFRVRQTDSLHGLRTCFGKIDVVVCNPPYRKMKAAELDPLRETYADVIEGQPNLYCLFIALCLRLLRAEGHAALVTPTSFLSGQYFTSLRKFLISNSVIEHIGVVSDRQGIFIDVEQETAMTVLRRRSEKGRSQTSVSVVSSSGQYRNVGKCSLPSDGAVWPVPRATTDVPLLKAASATAFRLSDYGYKVRIGAYVWNRDKRPKFETQQDVRKARAHTAMPLLWSRDIVPGRAVQLDSVSARDGEHRFVDMGDKMHSSVVSSPCVVIQRVTSNDQPRRLVAAAVSPDVYRKHGGFIGENHVVIVEVTGDKPHLSPTKLASLLSTYVVDRNFRCISGATNVSAFELNQLALPDPQAVKDALAEKVTMEEAVKRAFNLSDVAGPAN